jgi:hypothetical protein
MISSMVTLRFTTVTSILTVPLNGMLKLSAYISASSSSSPLLSEPTDRSSGNSTVSLGCTFPNEHSMRHPLDSSCTDILGRLRGLNVSCRGTIKFDSFSGTLGKSFGAINVYAISVGDVNQDPHIEGSYLARIDH